MSWICARRWQGTPSIGREGKDTEGKLTSPTSSAAQLRNRTISWLTMMAPAVMPTSRMVACAFREGEVKSSEIRISVVVTDASLHGPGGDAHQPDRSLFKLCAQFPKLFNMQSAGTFPSTECAIARPGTPLAHVADLNSRAGVWHSCQMHADDRDCHFLACQKMGRP